MEIPCAPRDSFLIIAYDVGQAPRTVGSVDPDQLENFFSFDLGTTLFHVVDEKGALVEIAADTMLIKYRANKR